MVSRASLDLCGKSRTHWDKISGPSRPQKVSLSTALSRPTSLVYSGAKHSPPPSDTFKENWNFYLLLSLPLCFALGQIYL